MMENSFRYTDTGEAKQQNLLCVGSHFVIVVNEMNSGEGKSIHASVFLGLAVFSYFVLERKSHVFFNCVFP